MDKIKSLVGMVSRKKFFSACKCYKDNRYGINYVRPHYYVICTNLECDATVGRFQPTEEEAVAVWNRRDGEEK